MLAASSHKRSAASADEVCAIEIKPTDSNSAEEKYEKDFRVLDIGGFYAWRHNRLRYAKSVADGGGQEKTQKEEKSGQSGYWKDKIAN
ncbi:MAG: hypothetical protein J2P21_15465 [Chloracidobacterium sp.]|nr:hypothetical protein [Chloracidobacterium sp.]